MSSVKILKDFTNTDVYNRPTICKECEGVMIFKGVGEYKCEKCGFLDYDDYGKVRNYLEKHVGATSAQVAEATGVSMEETAAAIGILSDAGRHKCPVAKKFAA